MKHLLLAVGVLLTVCLTSAAEETDFEQQILPILQNRCFKCHGPKKQEGDFRLDTKAGAFQEDYILAPGEPDDSELLVRISLPADDEDTMPPEGDRLTKQQIELIRGWIAGGAVWPDDVVTVAPEPPKRTSPLTRLVPLQPTAAEAAAIEKLAEMGIAVRPVAVDVIWTTANLRGTAREEVSTALDALAQVKTLTDLNLADCDLTDDDVAKLSSLTNLTRLHLEKNPITSAALAHLEPLMHLDYLNLYGTSVSDDGLAHLNSMQHLRKLYVWESQVTQAGVDGLKADLPQLEVVMGVTLAPVVVVEAAAEETAAAIDSEGEAVDDE